MTGFDRLHQRYPHPAECPGLYRNVHGWRLHTDHMLTHIPDTECVAVEIGSWTGKTTLSLLRHRPRLRMVCIDTWKGGPEHQPGRQHWQPFLPQLYEQFIRNTWDNKHRVVAVRETSADGISAACEAGIAPVLAYIDGAHDSQTVYADVSVSLVAWPTAHICGDDWGNAHVERGVERAAEECGGVKIVTHGMYWEFEKRGDA